MKIKKIKVYEFKELSKEAKEKAIQKWYEHEDYPFLLDDLRYSLQVLLEQHKIKYDDTLKQYYSLGYSQGDGYCFIGKFKWKNYYINITHNFRYYHKYSTDIMIETNCANEAKQSVYEKFKNLYYEICSELEKEGYRILRYRMDNKEFNDLCEANNYTFLENGTMENI